MKNEKDIIVCRCEDVTLEQIREKIKEGYTNFEDLKRLLRVGMGPCQGNTCGHLIQRELATYLGIPIEKVKTHKSRPLAMGVPLKAIAEDQNENI